MQRRSEHHKAGQPWLHLRVEAVYLGRGGVAALHPLATGTPTLLR